MRTSATSARSLDRLAARRRGARPARRPPAAPTLWRESSYSAARVAQPDDEQVGGGAAAVRRRATPPEQSHRLRAGRLLVAGVAAGGLAALALCRLRPLRPRPLFAFFALGLFLFGEGQAGELGGDDGLLGVDLGGSTPSGSTRSATVMVWPISRSVMSTEMWPGMASGLAWMIRALSTWSTTPCSRVTLRASPSSTMGTSVVRPRRRRPTGSRCAARRAAPGGAASP